MKNRHLKISFITVLLSFFIHIYLASSHYSFKYGIGTGKSLCSINETLNCEAVSISPYSYILNIPLAIWGLFFHLSYIFLFFFLFKEGQFERTRRWINFMSTASLVVSIAMAFISFTFMTTYCLFCMSLYLFSVANFAVLWISKDSNFLPTRDDIPLLFASHGFRSFFISVILIPVFAFFTHDLWKKSYSQISNYLIEDGLNAWEKSPEYSFSNPLLVKGDPKTAAFRIVEFADFMCPHCQHAVHTMESFIKANKSVSLEFFAFPLDSQCNPGVQSGTGVRCQLAKAVFCSEKQKKGWDAHSWIFKRLGSQNQTDFTQMKIDLNLDSKIFDECLISDESLKFITENAKTGINAKVEGTPAVYVNNKKLNFGNTVPVLQSLYKKLQP